MTYAQFWRRQRLELIKLGITSAHMLDILKIEFHICWERGGVEALKKQIEKISHEL